MIARMAWNVAAMAGLVFLAFVLVVSSAASLKIAAVLVPALVAGAAILLNPFLGLVLLVLFAQLDAIANMLSAGLPLSFYKLLSLATLGGFGLMSYAKRRESRLGGRSAETALVVMFILAMVLSFLQSLHKPEGLDHMIGFLSVILLFFLISVLADTPEKLEILLWALVVSGLVSSAIVLLDTLLGIRLVSTSAAAATAQFEGQSRSAGASDFNPTTAAHMMMATTIIAGVLFIRHPRFRALSGLAFLLGVPALVLTFARSAAIAFGIIAIVFAWHQRGHRFFALTLVLVLLAAGAAIPFVPPLYWERMWTLFDFGLDRTLLRRVSYNIIGLELWAQHPVLGVGPGNFPQYYASAEFRFMPGREPLPRQLHNSYMEVAAEMGLLGISLFLGVMLSAQRKARLAAAQAATAMRPLASALAYGFAAFLIGSVFMPNEDTKFMWILPALCVAAWRLSLPAAGAGAKDISSREY
ncbi:MAG: O-antigen ligase family protein [Paracoccaceae bacterium]